MKSMTTLAQRLVLMRTKRGMSQVTLAGLAGMSQQGYAALESGTAKATTHIGSLAHHLGCNAYWLETGLGEAESMVELSRDERLVIDKMRQLKPSRLTAFLTFFLRGESE